MRVVNTSFFGEDGGLTFLARFADGLEYAWPVEATIEGEGLTSPDATGSSLRKSAKSSCNCKMFSSSMGVPGVATAGAVAVGSGTDEQICWVAWVGCCNWVTHTALGVGIYCGGCNGVLL